MRLFAPLIDRIATGGIEAVLIAALVPIALGLLVGLRRETVIVSSVMLAIAVWAAQVA